MRLPLVIPHTSDGFLGSPRIFQPNSINVDSIVNHSLEPARMIIEPSLSTNATLRKSEMVSSKKNVGKSIPSVADGFPKPFRHFVVSIKMAAYSFSDCSVPARDGRCRIIDSRCQFHFWKRRVWALEHLQSYFLSHRYHQDFLVSLHCVHCLTVGDVKVVKGYRFRADRAWHGAINLLFWPVVN